MAGRRQDTKTTLEWLALKNRIENYIAPVLSIFLPPSSPPSVLLTSLRSARANTHALILCFSQISF
jgi:hypothetical protein